MSDPGADPPLDAFGFDLPEDEWLSRVRELLGPSSSLGRIGEYDVLEEISRGGQGIVFRARQPRTGRVVALKRLLAGSFATAERRQRFEREMEITARLQHPGIVTLHGMEVLEGQPTLAMEWIDGVPIDHWAARGPGGGRRPAREILRLMVEVARAVHHAHQRGVLHRDLKPANVLVDREGRPHVLDFGVAKLLEEDESLTRTAEFMGSPAFAPPEQLREGARAADVRGDVYSLGVILYVLLAGRLPYDKDLRVAQRLSAIERSAPPSASSLADGVDPELDTLLAKSLAADRELRYPSVDAFAADLERHLEGRPILAHPPSAWYHLRKLVRRNRPLFALGLLALLLLVGFAAQTHRSARRLEQERNRAVEVLEYLRGGVLGAMDPYLGGGRFDLRQVLATATERLDDRFSDQPDVRLELREVLGLAKRRLGDLGGARADLERVERALAADGDAPPVRLARVRTALASMRFDRSEFAGAEELLSKAEEALRALGKDGELPLVDTAETRAHLDLTLGRYDDARRRIDEIESILLRREGPRAPRLLTVSLLRSRLDSAESRFDAAAERLRTLLPECVETLGADAPLVHAVKRRLGIVLIDLGRTAEGEALLEEVLEQRRERLGEDHPDTAQSQVDVASARIQVLRGDGAERMLRHAIQVFQDSGAGEHDTVAQAYNLLAEELMHHGEVDEADHLMRTALARVKERFGPFHPSVTNVMTNYGTLLSMRGEHERARELFEEATAIRVRTLGPHHFDVAHGLNAQGLNAQHAGDRDAAMACYARALEVLRRAGKASWHGVVVWNNLASCHADRGERVEAKAAYEEGLAAARAVGLAPSHVDHAMAARGLARLCLLDLEHARAEVLFRELLEHPESVAGREWLVAHDLIGLAVAVASQGGLPECLTLIDRADAELALLGERAPPHLVQEAREVRRRVEGRLKGEPDDPADGRVEEPHDPPAAGGR